MISPRDLGCAAHDSELVYHVAPIGELREGILDGCYAPRALAREGFVHCSPTPEVTLAVAKDYYGECRARGEALLVLALDVRRLAPPLRFEPAAPIAGGGRSHLRGADLFPHLYGPVNLDAVQGAGVLAPSEDGYRWPATLVALEQVMHASETDGR